MNAFKMRHFFCIFSVCLITACAPHKMTPELSAGNKTAQNVPHLANEAQKPSTGKPKKQASAITSWDLSGALAAKSQSKGWTASLNWLQQGSNRYQIRLFGPLGGGTVIVEKQGSVVTFVDGNKKVSSSNADSLLQKQTGVRLPVHSLYYWVRGLPAPGAVQSSQHDENNHLTSLHQGGYNINYSNYTSVGNYDLPGKIHLQGNGVVIKLIIKHWKV
jgi:outer membrane lipoprotein LolB